VFEPAELSAPVSLAVDVSVESEPLVSGGGLVASSPLGPGTLYVLTKTSPVPPPAPPVVGATLDVATHWTTCPLGTSATAHFHAEVEAISGACFDAHATVVASAPERITSASECIRLQLSAMLRMRMRRASTVPHAR
jgi:hypothetical protein